MGEGILLPVWTYGYSAACKICCFCTSLRFHHFLLILHAPFMPLLNQQGDWLSKEPDVFCRVQMDATTTRRVLAASSPAQQ